MINRAPIIKRIPIIKNPENHIIVEPAKKVYFGTEKLNTKVFRRMATMTTTAMAKVLIEGKQSKITESEHQIINGTSKKVEAITKFWFEIVEGNDMSKVAKLTPTDQWVLGACMAELQKGNVVTTADIIFRNCGGIGKPMAKDVKEILKSVDKMMSLKIYIDATDTKKKLHQLRREYSEEFENVVADVILPAYYTYSTLNGQPSTLTIKLRDVSPILKYARAKGQITEIPTPLLLVPHRKNTPLFRDLKGYINTRIQSIKHTRKYNSKFPTSITMEKLVEHCHCGDSIKSKDFRKRLWMDIINYMDFLVEQYFITKYKFLDREGNKATKWDSEGKLIFSYKEDSSDKSNS